MAIRPDYDIGTVTLTSGSSDFTTSGSALQTAAVQAGDAIITPSGHVLIIASVTGQNSGTLFLPCPPDAAGTGLALRIRFQPDGSRYQGAVRNLIDLLSSGNLEAFAALVGASGMVPIFTGPGTLDLADPATFGIQDPNGSLGKLAGLADVDNLSELAGLTLAPDKVLTTDGAGELTQSDITTAARALLNLTGTAAADQLPYLTANNAAGLTPLTAFARTVLDDANGPSMLATLGLAISDTGALDTAIKIPVGSQAVLIQGATVVVTTNATGGASITLPAPFADANYRAIAVSGDPGPGVFNISMFQEYKSANSFSVQVNRVSDGAAATNSPARIDFFAIGRAL